MQNTFLTTVFNLRRAGKPGKVYSRPWVWGFLPSQLLARCPCPTSLPPRGASCHGGFSQSPGKHPGCVFCFPSAAPVFFRDMRRPQTPSPEFLRASKGCWGNSSVFLQLLVICCSTSSAQSHPPHPIPDTALAGGARLHPHTLQLVWLLNFRLIQKQKLKEIG